MASITLSLSTAAALADVWDAIRDVGALHTRLVPGFVVATHLDGNVRTVTFANGMSIDEPIVAIDDRRHRLVWTARGGASTHYNGALHAAGGPTGTTDVTWTVDVLPDEIAPAIEASMTAGMAAMQLALDALVR